MAALNATDSLSRNPLAINATNHDRQEYINMIINHATPKGSTIQDIAEATKADPTLSSITNSIQSNNWSKKQKPFFQIRHELSIHKGILLKGHNIVIPESLRNNILEIAHKQHLGAVKIKSLLREKVWWPGISSAVDQMVASCHTCQVITPPMKTAHPVQMTELPHNTWETVGIDLKGPLPSGENLLVLLDYRSRFPIVQTLKRSISSSEIIHKLQKTFSLFGYPQEIISDNGKQFISEEFKSFLKQHHIKHHPVTPYWPQANGEVERFNASIGKVLRYATLENKDWRKELDDFLLTYRSTPHCGTQVSPADLFF